MLTSTKSVYEWPPKYLMLLRVWLLLNLRDKILKWGIQYHHGLNYVFDCPLAHVFVSIICTTHVPQTFVVAINPDEFIIVVLSPLRFSSVWKINSTAGFIKTRYAKLRNNFPSTAIVNRLALLFYLHLHLHCDGLHRASRQSIARWGEKNLSMGEGKWASYSTFSSITRLDHYSSVTWLFTRPNYFDWSS
jgi:hypothetical protein